LWAGRCGKEDIHLADFYNDGDVVQDDFGIFQRCISGEDNSADPDCTD